ncbi:MAG: DUF2235 domain-containing protein, partial [Thermoleophilaceae bacterium]|nr:DUF2235 domain-containing protein [Thermoleophilaceae bacterium]
MSVHQPSPPVTKQGKQIVICCDGTWMVPEQDSPSSIGRIARLASLANPDPVTGQQRIVNYRRGVGGRGHFFDKMLGGGFGLGLEADIKDAYAFLASNYDVGDEIYIFGWSRGAFTARALAGMVDTAGLLTRDNILHIGRAYRKYRERDDYAGPSIEDEIHPRTPGMITFLGVFDTVGALGVPLVGLGKSNGFKTANLGKTVNIARHALAIDDPRTSFEPTVWQEKGELVDGEWRKCDGDTSAERIKQVWFSGVHADIGGGYNPKSYSVGDDGYKNGHLGYFPLRWMLEEARAAGLNLHAADRSAALDAMLPKRCHNEQIFEMHDSGSAPYWLIDKLRYLIKIAWKGDFRWYWRRIQKSGAVSQSIDQSVIDLYKHQSDKRQATDQTTPEIEIVRDSIRPFKTNFKIELRRNKELHEVLKPDSSINISSINPFKPALPLKVVSKSIGFACIAALLAATYAIAASIPWHSLGNDISS